MTAESPRSDFFVSVIAPLENQAEIVKPFVEQVLGILRAHYANYELLLVDDGSTDSTRRVLEELTADEDRLDMLSLERNSGKCEAVRRGMLRAFEDGADAAGYWDADLATPLSEIERFRDALLADEDLDVVLGSRILILGADIDRRPLRHYFGRIAATAASMTLRLPVYDTQCGAKVLRTTERLRTILQEPFRANWTFDVELLARFLWSDPVESLPDPLRTIYEYPLPVWRDVGGSKLRMTDYPRAATDLLTIYLTYARPARREGRSLS